MLNTTSSSSTVAGVSINERAMLVDLSIKMWSASKHDKKVSAEVADAHNASSDAGRYNKRLIAKDARAELQKIATEARDYHYTHTLPWLDNGARILASVFYLEYAAAMRGYTDRWQRAVENFRDAYPQIVADARHSLNGLFNADDYPAPSEIKRKFTFGYNILPMPQAADFRVDVGALEIQRIQSQLESLQQDVLQAAVKDCYGRVFEAVGRMSERLAAYKVTADGVEHPFRDSLVENVRELAALLPGLNITDDLGLAAITSQVQDRLCVYDGDTLRASQTAREQTAQAADDILAAVSEYMA